MKIEDTIINNIKKLFGSNYIGDDCAVMGNQIITKDIFISGTHFPEELDPYFSGWRSFAGAVSDIAAMGGRPEYFLMGIGGKNQEEINRTIEGVLPLHKTFNIELAGGDTVFSSRLFLSFTVIGRAEKPILRNGARDGDMVYITGDIGGARAGLEEILHGGQGNEKFLKPMPRVKESIELVNNYRINAMIDISDGLLRDAERISAASGVSIHLSSKDIPINPEAKIYCRENGIDVLTFSINSGEEYELLFTSPDEIDLPFVKRIGIVKSGRGIFLDEKPVTPEGFEHFGEGA